ncbi:MAG TPA: Ku protein [Streptosporangiaceae bacterium]|nr:Ku protein [Streptosporangiaceae bacterium]
MRSMWKGAVSFGLVMIPVKLYAATETQDIAFRQVHREDGGRIRFRRFCTIDEQEVPYEDIAKGYELPGGEMVVLTEEDMADLPLPTTKNIEVVQFCPIDQLDPILLNRSYYVEPEAAGARAYCLLRDALEESGKIAIAQVALRQRESLAVLRARDGVLVLETLLWPDEVRDPAFGFLSDDIEVRPQELRMASSLIESMTVDFDPDEFHDSYREALQELVAAKTEGREVVQPELGGAPAGDTTSLADALRASLAAARGGKLGAVPDVADEEDETPAQRRGTGTKASTAKAGAAKASTAKASAVKTGTAKGSAAAKSSAAKDTPSAARSGAAGKAGATGKPAAKTAAPAKAGTRAKAASAEEEKTAQRRPRRAS